MNNGWIKLWRKVWDTDLFIEKRVFSRFEAWVDMLLMADHTNKKHLINGEWVETNRGEFPVSERFLEIRWRWSRKKVRNFLGNLEREGMVNKNSTTKGTIVHIIKYSTYQDRDTTEDTTKEPPKIQLKNQIQEDKEVKKIKNKESIYHSESKPFLSFYAEKFKQCFGTEPNIQWAKDAGLIKSLLRKISIEELKDLLDRFFTSDDKFIMSSGYTIGVFYSQINKLKIGSVKHQGLKQWANEIIEEERYENRR